MRRSTKYSKYQAKLDHAKPFPIELYMTKKENSQLIYDDRTTYMMCNCCLAALDVWPEHTFKRENFPFLPFYRNESLMEHSQSNRALLFYLQKRMLAHKEAMAHKTQLPNEWQAKILLQIHLKVSADLLAVYFLIGFLLKPIIKLKQNSTLAYIGVNALDNKMLWTFSINCNMN